MRIACVMLILFLSLAVARPAEEKATDLDRMQGTWLVVSLVEEGKVIDAKETALLEIVIAKDIFRVYKDGKPAVYDKIKLDESKSPKAIDLMHLSGDDKGKTEPGIYVFEKDQLKICLNEKARERPATFEGKETIAYSVIVLKKKEVEKGKEKDK